MKLRTSLSFFAFLAAFGFALAQSPAVQAQEIGQGYSCDGTTIVKKGKTVSLKSAKQKIQAKIAALGSSQKDKAKKTALKAIKAALVACSNGTFIPTSSPGDVAGTYSGTLTRTSSKGASSLCDYDTSIVGSFLVEVEGANVKVLGSINPFHIPVSGKRKGNGYELTGSSGAFYRKLLTLNLSNVTDTSGDFTAERSGSAYSPVARKFVTVCSVHYSGTGFTRVK